MRIDDMCRSRYLQRQAPWRSCTYQKNARGTIFCGQDFPTHGIRFVTYITTNSCGIDQTSRHLSIYDSISYYKGATLIRMVPMFLGVDKFQPGIHIYLKAVSFSSTTQKDLWRYLSEATNNTIDMERIMDGWTQQAGYPLVEVDRIHSTTNQEGAFGYMVDSQRPFNLLSTMTTKQNQWWIPFKHFDKTFNPVSKSYPYQVISAYIGPKDIASENEILYGSMIHYPRWTSPHRTRSEFWPIQTTSVPIGQGMIRKVVVLFWIKFKPITRASQPLAEVHLSMIFLLWHIQTSSMLAEWNWIGPMDDGSRCDEPTRKLLTEHDIFSDVQLYFL